MAEKNTLRLLILSDKLCSGRMAQWHKASLFALEEVGLQVQIPGATCSLFFSFLSFHFYPLACFRLFPLLTLFSSSGFLR